MIKVYLAGPWFNPEQDEREQRVKKKLRDLGFEVFSPRDETELKSDASEEDQRRVFDEDISGICNADLVFAITNGKDMGTLFECGYAYANHIPIVYFAEGLTGNFNLMLAQSANIVYTSLDDIDPLKICKCVNDGLIIPYKGAIE